MLGGELHVGQHIGLGLVHEVRQPGHAWPGLIGDLTPLLAGGLGVVLGEGGADPRGDDAALGLTGIGPPFVRKAEGPGLGGKGRKQ